MGLVNMLTRIGRNALRVGRSCDLLELIDRDARVIEASVRDAGLATFLRDHGRDRYLGLVSPRREAGLGPLDPDLSRRFVVRQTREEAYRNNADVLVVQGPDSELMLSHHEYRHAEYVAWAGGGGVRQMIAGIAGVVLHVMHNHIRVLGTARLPGTRRRYLIVGIVNPTRWGARRYISPLAGVAGFFEELNEAGIDYVVLRWFETLPRLDPGEDVDLLVADEDVPRLETVIEREPGLIPCDVYSASGLPGTAYQNMAYFPPPIAREILRSGVLSGKGIRVPAPREHLLSMAFHAVYHKDVTSGLPGASIDPREHASPDHDYAQVLTELAARQGIEIEPTLDWLDGYLASEGWRPPADTLTRLSGRNPWLRNKLEREREGFDPEWEGLAVFLVRERAATSEDADTIADSIRDAGFHVVRNELLGRAVRERLREGVRGANWDRGPFPVSGGSPARAIVAWDPRPIPPTAEDLERHPGLDNRRLLVKQRMRDAFNEGLPETEHCNVLHTSDNSFDALQYLRMIDPEGVGPIRRDVVALRTAHEAHRHQPS